MNYNNLNELEYEVGNPNFKGKTKLKVFKNLNATIEFEQASNLKSYQGKIERSDFIALKKLAASADICSLKERKENIEPGDVLIGFILKSDLDLCDVRAWLSERYKDKKLDKLILKLNEVISHVTNGEVTH